MTPAKLNIFWAFFPYGGNGQSQKEHPVIRNWWAKTLAIAKADPRVGENHTWNFADTPITMTRNESVTMARRNNCDVLVMCDSDQHPDLYLGKDPLAKPFFESTFDFLYERKMQGKVTVCGAPYCGGPPSECVFIFRWRTMESEHPNADSSLQMYTREEAAVMAGIHPAAAIPTGLIMFDMEMFNVTDPIHEFKALEKTYGARIARELTKPWFYYQWENIYADKKASTEDVTVSRDMNLLAYAKLGYSPVFCNWDCWAGHDKPKCVGKPQLVTTDMIGDKFAEAVRSERNSEAKMVDIGEMNAKAGNWRERCARPETATPDFAMTPAQDVHVNGTRVTIKE